MPPSRQEERGGGGRYRRLAAHGRRGQHRAHRDAAQPVLPAGRDAHQGLRGQPRPGADPAGGRACVLRKPAHARPARGRSRGHQRLHRAQQARPGRRLRAGLGTTGGLPAHGHRRAAAGPATGPGPGRPARAPRRPPHPGAGPLGRGQEHPGEPTGARGSRPDRRDLARAQHRAPHHHQHHLVLAGRGAGKRTHRFAGLPGIRPAPPGGPAPRATDARPARHPGRLPFLQLHAPA